MSSNIICSLFGHKVSRRNVRRDGETYIGRCKRCRARMERSEKGWRLRGAH